MMDDESSHSDLDLAVLQALLKGISPLCYVQCHHFESYEGDPIIFFRQAT